MLASGLCELPKQSHCLAGSRPLANDEPFGSLFMYVYYSEEEADAELHGRRPSISGADRTFRRAKRAIRVLIAACSFAMAVLVVSSIILHSFPWVAQTWANILGIAVACFACVQWIPQIRTTWHLGHLGSLSPVSLCLMAPVRCSTCHHVRLRT